MSGYVWISWIECKKNDEQLDILSSARSCFSICHSHTGLMHLTTYYNIHITIQTVDCRGCCIVFVLFSFCILPASSRSFLFWGIYLSGSKGLELQGSEISQHQTLLRMSAPTGRAWRWGVFAIAKWQVASRAPRILQHVWQCGRWQKNNTDQKGSRRCKSQAKNHAQSRMMSMLSTQYSPRPSELPGHAQHLSRDTLGTFDQQSWSRPNLWLSAGQCHNAPLGWGHGSALSFLKGLIMSDCLIWDMPTHKLWHKHI